MIAAVALVVVGCGLAADPIVLPIPGAAGDGIGFDDLAYAPSIDRIVVPAGATMKVHLIDPATHMITGTATLPKDPAAEKKGGHGDGVTSAVLDATHKVIVAIDRNHTMVHVLDATTLGLLSSTKLAAGPDYVRVAEKAGEVWVTEPHGKQIEVFAYGADRTQPLQKIATISIPLGPESLVIDEAHGRAYTHAWKSESYAIDVAKHAVVATWPNGCSGSRGIALDLDAGLLLVGCAEGKVTALDLTSGAVKGSLQAPVSDVDIVAWNPSLRHLYVPGAKTMAIVGVKKDGAMSSLGTVATAGEAHCVVADTHGQAWVCDPDKGRILVVKDAPASN